MQIELKDLSPRHSHDLLTSCIVPRPIAWVTTVNEEGKINIAPFSFFTGVSWAPPIIAFSVVNRADGTKKDTVLNIEKIPEFVVNMVSVELLKVMEATAAPIPYGQDEKIVKGVSLAASEKVRPQRIAQSKVSLECTLERIVRVTEGADAGNLILGRVELMHISDALFKGEREMDWGSLDALGRLSGACYCTTRSVIESKKN